MPIEKPVGIRKAFVVNHDETKCSLYVFRMFLGDILLEGGIYKSLSSGIEYEEKRLFLANIFLVKFIFLTR